MKLDDLKKRGVSSQSEDLELVEKEITYTGKNEAGEQETYTGTVHIVVSRWKQSKELAELVKNGVDHVTALIHIYVRLDGGSEVIPVDLIDSFDTGFINALVAAIQDVTPRPDMGKD